MKDFQIVQFRRPLRIFKKSFSYKENPDFSMQNVDLQLFNMVILALSFNDQVFIESKSR